MRRRLFTPALVLALATCVGEPATSLSSATSLTLPLQPTPVGPIVQGVDATITVTVDGFDRFLNTTTPTSSITINAGP